MLLDTFYFINKTNMNVSGALCGGMFVQLLSRSPRLAAC